MDKHLGTRTSFVDRTNEDAGVAALELSQTLAAFVPAATRSMQRAYDVARVGVLTMVATKDMARPG